MHSLAESGVRNLTIRKRCAERTHNRSFRKEISQFRTDQRTRPSRPGPHSHQTGRTAVRTGPWRLSFLILPHSLRTTVHVQAIKKHSSADYLFL